ncbi:MULTISPECIES: hypothetical protein [unclassified Pseudomonas]|nr:MULTISPECIES: hypothetical protein [unclassified Pseudomonas]SDQ68292.1 hypothetical protein SAMN05216487_3253 [Pseudomonas sp. UC 17F4]
MTWTIIDTAGMLLLVMVIASTWCLGRGQLIAMKRKREEGGPCS